MKHNVTERVFECSKCKHRLTAWKSSTRRTASGHIKTMYCPYCQKVRNFVQLKYI